MKTRETTRFVWKANCKGCHQIKWSKTINDVQYWKCSICGKEFTRRIPTIHINNKDLKGEEYSRYNNRFSKSQDEC